MSDDVKSQPRRERAARTRQLILDAAEAEFSVTGYHGATMAAIARRAGVAVQTVYFVFNTKPALLTAAIDRAVMGAEDLPPTEMPWWHESVSTSDGRDSLRLFVEAVVKIETRAAGLGRVARTAAATDPDLADLLARHENLRKEGFSRFVGTLAYRGLLLPGIDPDEVTDVLLTLVGADVYLEMTRSRGWSVERYVDWTTQVLTQLYVHQGT